MPKTHPDEKMLEKFGRGKLSRRENMKVSWHLFNCAACRQEVETLAPEGKELLENLFTGLDPQDVADNPSYDRAFVFGQSTLEVRGEARDRDRARAPKLFTELMRHPVSRQQALIERTWRFKNYVFAEFLLDQCQQVVVEDPARAEDLAHLALVVAEQLEGSHYGEALINDLKARAWAHTANARRVQTDLRAADEAFEQATAFSDQGTDDVLLAARLLSLKGSLRLEQRRFDEARELTTRALGIYREAGEAHWVGRTMIVAAKIEEEAGLPEKAIEMLREAQELIDAKSDPRLGAIVQLNLCCSLHVAGRYEEAKKLLPQARRVIAEHGSQLDQLRVEWVAARIARDLRDLKEAEKIFRQVRDQFVERRIAYDAALASLDLAAVYIQQSRTAETKVLAQEMLPIFRSRDVHREATAALLVFQKAAQAETVTVKMVHDIATFLREARRNPELVYKAS